MTPNGKTKWITLGHYPELSLRDARMKSMLTRADILDPKTDVYKPPEIIGMPDLPEKNEAIPLFRDVAKVWFDRKVLGLSNGKHIQQNWNTLKTYVFPQLGALPIDQIKQRHLIAVFDPIWRIKHTTAKRTLGRVEEVFELAKLLEHIEINPASFKRQIAFGRVTIQTRHQPSLDRSRAPDLWQWILKHDVAEDVRQMLMVMLLTGKRTKEVRMVQWIDLELDQLIWTSQREHMKMRRAHRIPICKQLDVIFDNMSLLTGTSDAVFARPKNKLGVIDENCARLEFQKFYPNITEHGMRATFRTWLRKQNCYSQDLMETALSHEKDPMVNAYMRDDLLDERRPTMQNWADYVTGGAMPPRLQDQL